MNFLKSIWITCSHLSLDVVLGAMAGLLFFSKLFRIPMDLENFLLLGIAVWAIYTLDHLWDARKAKELVSSRHLFHSRYQMPIAGLAIAILIVGITLAIWFLGFGKDLFWSLGFGSLVLVTMYLLRKAGKASGGLKELCTAVFYVVGIAWFPLLKIIPIELNYRNLSLLVLYIFLALINLLMLSVLDHREDQVQGFSSATERWEPNGLVLTIRKFALVLILGALASFILMPSFYRPFACILLLMLLVHYLTFFQNQLSSEEKRRRMEAAFLLPWILALLV